MANTLRSKTLTASLPGGCEIVLTLIQPPGVSDTAFEDYLRWAERTLSELKTIPQAEETRAPSPSAEPPIRTSGLWSAVKAVLIPEKRDAPAPEIAAPEITAAETAPSAPNSGRKLYVGNLPYVWTDEMLRELFAAQGTVVTAEIARFGRRGGRSRGFGFVEMSTEAEAQTAIEKLHEALAGDRKMVVRLARSREHGPADTATSGKSGDSSQSQPVAPKAARLRTARPGRGRPPARPARPDNAPLRKGSERPARQTGISNNSGYEIYPRSTQGDFSSEPTSRSSAPPRSSVESSPYMDDTGDVENRGNRPPPRRRRRG